MADPVSMQPVGDPHNFGKRVSFCQGYEGPIVVKPRTVFWEHLFLDASSEFRNLLRNLSDSKTDSYLGSVAVSNEPPYLEGHAAAFTQITSTAAELSEKNLNSFGRLISFASVYGLTDLHLENLVMTATGVQLLDVECVFALVESPLDSLLVPSRALNSSRSIFSEVLKAPPVELMETLIMGLFSEFNFLRSNRDKMLEFHSAKSDLYSQIPIRFLIRPSKEYVSSSDMNVRFPILRSEAEQIARGDIPYFFGFMGQNKINYFNASNTFIDVQEEFASYTLNKLSRSFRNPQELLQPDRMLRLQKQSIMVTLSKLLDKRSDFSYRGGMFECAAKSGTLNFKCDEFELAAKLPESL